MNSINISVDGSKSALERMMSIIEGDIQAYEQKYTGMTSILNESSGDFTEALKEQLAEEEKLLEASVILLKSICKAMRSGVDLFVQQDQAISNILYRRF